MDAAHIREIHRLRHLCEEPHALCQRIHQRHTDVRRIDGEWDAGESCACPHIDQRLRSIEQRGIVRRQTVDHMLHRDIRGRGQCREVHARIPLHEQCVVDAELRNLLLRQRNLRLLRTRGQNLLEFGHASLLKEKLIRESAVRRHR